MCWVSLFTSPWQSQSTINGVIGMEMWELATRVLASANEGQSFTPAIAGGNYRRDLELGGETQLPPIKDFHSWAEEVASNLKFAGLIESVVTKPGRLAMLDVMRRTAFGDELYEALQRRGMISALSGMQVLIDAEAIRRALHQLNS